MGFVELEKSTTLIKRLAVHAVYRVNDKGVGTLRFTKNGIEKLAELKLIEVAKEFKLYIDKDTKSLAFKQSEDGKFKLSGLAQGKNTLSYAVISKEITETVRYMIQQSKEYTFVLVPVKDGEDKAEVVKAQEPETTTKKGKGNKK